MPRMLNTLMFQGVAFGALLMTACTGMALTPPSAMPAMFDLPTGSVVSPGRTAVQPETIRLRPLTESQLARHSVKVAAVQITGTWFYPNINGGGIDPADAVVTYIEKAAKDKVDLIAFPELYLGMYRLPHPSTDKIAAAARKHSMYVVVGLMEVTDAVGTHFNSSLIFDRQGVVVGRYNKTHAALGEMPYLWPPIPNDPEWVFTEGDEFPIFDLDFGRVGIITCYDGYFPEPWRILSLKGSEIIIWMNARGGSVEDYMVRTYVASGVTHVVSTNKAIGAGTMIARWPNQIVQEIKEPVEGLIVGDLPMDLLRNARKNDRQLIQRRPWIYGELLNSYDIASAYANAKPLPGAPPDSIMVRPGFNGYGVTASRADLPQPIEVSLSGLPDALATAPVDWQRVPETGELIGTAASDGISLQLSVYPRRDLLHVEVLVSNPAGKPELSSTPSLRASCPNEGTRLRLTSEGAPEVGRTKGEATIAGVTKSLQPGQSARWRFRVFVLKNGTPASPPNTPWDAWSSRLPQ